MKTTIAEIEAVLPETRTLKIAGVEAELRHAKKRHEATTRAFARSRAAVSWTPDQPPPGTPDFDRLARAHETAYRAYAEAGVAWADAEQALRALNKESV